MSFGGAFSLQRSSGHHRSRRGHMTTFSFGKTSEELEERMPSLCRGQRSSWLMMKKPGRSS